VKSISDKDADPNVLILFYDPRVPLCCSMMANFTKPTNLFTLEMVELILFLDIQILNNHVFFFLFTVSCVNDFILYC